MNLHNEIRRLAEKRVAVATEQGLNAFSIAVKDLIRDAEREGISTARRTPAFCKAIQAKKEFCKKNSLDIVRVDGPPKGLSTTVVVHYQRTYGTSLEGLRNGGSDQVEKPAERAERLVNRLRGLMRDEIAAKGGTLEYVRWARSDQEEE